MKIVTMQIPELGKLAVEVYGSLAFTIIVLSAGCYFLYKLYKESRKEINELSRINQEQAKKYVESMTKAVDKLPALDYIVEMKRDQAAVKDGIDRVVKYFEDYIIKPS